jgi:hypothetical protein
MSNMTLLQAAEYIGITAYQVKKLIQSKKLIDLGVNGDGKKRHKAIIPKESVDHYLSETQSVSAKKQESNTPASFSARLDRIERKLDRLISMWS